MSDLKLMEDYFWILEQCQDPEDAFSDSPTQKELSLVWLWKLCNDVYRGNDEQRLRNLYLLELSKCIKNGKLNKIFMTLPPKGRLQPIETTYKIEIDSKTIVDEMQAAALELIPQISPRNYQTHMSTKIFDDNLGACAYLAVSLGDPKDGPIWMEMGINEQMPKLKTETKVKECNEDVVNIEFLEFCLQKTANELANLSRPGECPVLEQQLVMYEKFLINYGMEEETCDLNESEFRTFLLMNFQTDLLHAIEAYKQRTFCQNKKVE